MFFGFLMTIGSTILFAFSESAIMMLVSRAIQGKSYSMIQTVTYSSVSDITNGFSLGIGTSFSTVSGLGLLAFKFQGQF